MRRRDFIRMVGGAAAFRAIATRAQHVASPRIGVLLVGLSPESKAAQHFRRGLRDAGYFEGRNVVIEWRYAKGDYERVPAFVDENANRLWLFGDSQRRVKRIGFALGHELWGTLCIRPYWAASQ